MIISRHQEYGSVINQELTIAASEKTLLKMDEIISRRCDYGSIFARKTQLDLRINLFPVEAFTSYDIGGYKITAYPANHGSDDQGCMIYDIFKDEKSILYATDTSVIFDSVWEQMSRKNSRFDMIVLDHTYGEGFESRDRDHLSSSGFISHVQKFIAEKRIINPRMIFATHISHEGNLLHSDFERFSDKNGYQIAFDGLVVLL